MSGRNYRLQGSSRPDAPEAGRGLQTGTGGPGIVSNALALYAVQGLNVLVPLIVLPYLLRVLSPDGYGSIMLAQSVMGYGIILTEFGFNLTSARDISVARNDPAAVARIFWTTTAAKLLLVVISLALAAAAIAFVPAFRRQPAVFAASSLLLIGNVAFPQWYLQGLERLREGALVQAVAKCVVATLTVVFVRAPGDVWIAALIMSSPQLAGALAARCMRIPLAPPTFYRPALSEIREALRRSFHVFASVVSTSLYLHLNTVVLGLMSGERQVALYTLGTRLVAALQTASSPVVQAVFPRASLLFAEDPRRAWQLLKRAAAWVLPGMALACLLLAAFAPTVVRLLGGASYTSAANVVRITAVVPLLVTLAAGLSQIVMVNIGMTRPLLWIYIAVGCLNLVLLPPLVIAFQASGAAAALTAAELLGPLLMAWVVWKRRPTGKLAARAGHEEFT